MHLRRKLSPAVVIAVHEHRFQKKEQYVWEKRPTENGKHIVGQPRVEYDQHKRQQSTERRGEGKGDRQQLGEFIGEVVVALVFCYVSDDLDDESEHRYGEYECREHEMELGDHPHPHPASDHRKRPIFGCLLNNHLRRRSGRPRDERIDGRYKQECGADGEKLLKGAADSGGAKLLRFPPPQFFRPKRERGKPPEHPPDRFH